MTTMTNLTNEELMNEELMENDLDNVDGGIAITTALLSAGMLAFGAANIAFYASYGYHKIVKKY